MLDIPQQNPLKYGFSAWDRKFYIHASVVLLESIDLILAHYVGIRWHNMPTAAYYVSSYVGTFDVGLYTS